MVPGPLYAILPYPVLYNPLADLGHSLTQLQLLLFAALAFAVLLRTGLYPPEQATINLDTDWLYRRLAPRVLRFATARVVSVRHNLGGGRGPQVGRSVMRAGLRHYGPEGTLARKPGPQAAWCCGSRCSFGPPARFCIMSSYKDFIVTTDSGYCASSTSGSDLRQQNFPPAPRVWVTRVGARQIKDIMARYRIDRAAGNSLSPHPGAHGWIFHTGLAGAVSSAGGLGSLGLAKAQYRGRSSRLKQGKRICR
ncbi:MAG: hypothetical protein CM1200mP20_11170 [Pseudomonadota bacterium]|nr:MAG: hypothetical protein CM1200mP20_11170 [Pseudomonadota bacterium]